MPKEQILIVDMRPQLFVIERLFYRDALQAASVISIGGELNVSDPYSAGTVLKDQVNDSIAIVREALRTTVSRGVIDATEASKAKTVAEIQSSANASLAQYGMRVVNVELTEVWSQEIDPPLRKMVTH